MCRLSRDTSHPAAGRWSSVFTEADSTAKAAVAMHSMLSKEHNWPPWQ